MSLYFTFLLKLRKTVVLKYYSIEWLWFWNL
jgi:hypothetical protein